MSRGRNGVSCSGHGVVTEDVDFRGLPVLQNNVYACRCTGPWTGHGCDTEVVPDPDRRAQEEKEDREDAERILGCGFDFYSYFIHF